MNSSDVKETLSQMKSMMAEVRSAVVISSGTRSATLPQISKPIRGVNYKRTINPVTWLRAKIQAYNETSSEAKYIQFSDTNDHRIAVHAKAVIGRLLRDHLGDEYGMVSWTRACAMRSSRESCEKVVEEASKMKEFVRFNYSYDGWAIRMLCDAKMKSAMRAEKLRAKDETVRCDTPSVVADVSRSDQENADEMVKNNTVQATEIVAQNVPGDTENENINSNRISSSANIGLPEKSGGTNSGPSNKLSGATGLSDSDDDLPIASFIVRTGSHLENERSQERRRKRTGKTTVAGSVNLESVGNPPNSRPRDNAKNSRAKRRRTFHPKKK